MHMTIRKMHTILLSTATLGLLALTGCEQIDQLRDKATGPALQGSAEEGFTATEFQANRLEARTHAAITFINDVYAGTERTIFVDPDLLPLLQAYYNEGQVNLASVDTADYGERGQIIDSQGKSAVIVLAEAEAATPTSATVQLTEQTTRDDLVNWQRRYVKQANGDWVAASEVQ